MSSVDSDVPSLEGMAITGIRAMILPVILSFAAASPPSQRRRDVTVIVNARSGSISFIEGAVDGFEAFLRKEGQFPATKASIEAMPVVKVGEEGIQCSICLEDFELGGDAKEMPCKHRYHQDCISTWLGIHGCCPLCRFKMPEADNGDEKVEEEGNAERLDTVSMVFHVLYRTGGGGSSSDSESDSESGTRQDDTSGGGDSETAMETDRQ